MSLVWIPKIAQIVTCSLALSWFLYLRIKAKAKDEISENINRAGWTFGVKESANRAKKQTQNNVPFCKGTNFLVLHRIDSDSFSSSVREIKGWI